LGVSYAIVRPTLVFGEGDILVNNMAWLLRRFPVFPIFGTGAYRLQPVYVGDLATLAITVSRGARSISVDSAGVEAFTFEEFIGLLASRIRPGIKLIHLPPAVGIALGRAIGFGMNDVILTATERPGLMEERLTSEQSPNGTTRFSEWLEARTDAWAVVCLKLIAIFVGKMRAKLNLHTMQL
jgi:NADH dehydrogenase